MLEDVLVAFGGQHFVICVKCWRSKGQFMSNFAPVSTRFPQHAVYGEWSSLNLLHSTGSTTPLFADKSLGNL